MIKLIHQTVNGRARFHVSELYRCDKLQHFLERSLIQQNDIQTVSANPLTGNVLVTFKDSSKLEQIRSFLEQIISTFKEKIARSPDFNFDNLDLAGAPEWHRLSAEQVIAELHTTDRGLTIPEVEEQRQQYGSNTISSIESRSDLTILLDQLKSMPVALLGVAAGISVLTGGIADAIVITGVIGVNAAIGYFTESQSERIIHSLTQRSEQPAIVIRNGSVIEIDDDDVVVGDILILRPGQFVPADGRLLQAKHLTIDESALTGESIPASKSSNVLSQTVALADRSNMIYRGTIVTGGQGQAIVVATGKRTEMGKIQSLVTETKASETPLSRQLDQVSSELVMLGAGVCGGVFGIGLLQGRGWLHMLQTAISLAVAAVPEGLPTIATTILALGVQDMRKHNVLVRNLSAVEGLGSLQVLCLDKTGTITENKMSVVEMQTALGTITVDKAKFTLEENQIQLDEYNILKHLIQIGVLCSESKIDRDKHNQCIMNGSSTENALIDLAINVGSDPIALRNERPQLSIKLRSEQRKFMTTVHKIDDHLRLVAMKGSPEEVLARCDRWLINGIFVPLTDDDRHMLTAANERMAGKALRVLAMAYKEIDKDSKEKKNKDLIWVGLVGMIDPIRKGVTPLIEQFHQAGIETVMITGDQPTTANAIAQDLHLSRTPEITVLDSTQLEKSQDYDRVNVFARVSPANKLQIVQAIESSGKVVAMTGDGMNDAPALKAADIGVAMGRSGTDVAREVADIVLEDDRLETLINAVSQGRTIYSNIRKSVHFLLATNLSEIIVTLAAIAVGGAEPLNPLQLLWLNLLSDIFPGLALALEPAEPDVLQQPPHDASESIVPGSDYGRIVFEGSTISAGTLAAYTYGLMRYGAGTRASSIAFMSLSSAQLLHALTCRSDHHRVFDFGKDSLPINPYLIGGLAASFGLQFLAVSVPWLRYLLKVDVLDPIDWSVVGASAIAPLVVNDLTKE